MPQIRILPEALSNKIAAGEVVERPASVVKELLENAIDAQSTDVAVEIKKGGRALIRVSDNGVGMDHDDCLRATERYATSKICDENDLFSIATLGFRGEALPSIASVSDMEIITRTESSDVGTRVVVKGGQIEEASEVGTAKGTMVTVNRLFFNTPARRKFLKTDQTEIGHISDTVTRIALAWPNTRFRFFHNGKALGNWSSTLNPLHRIADILKSGLEEHLYEVDYKERNIRIHGYVASPEVTRATSHSLYIYVNGRFVKDKVLYHAITEGYAGRLMKGRFPLVVLFLALPPDKVDVNVHPTKSLVRFEAPTRVHNAISEGIAVTLQTLSRPTWGKRPILQPVPRARPYTVYPPGGKVKVSEPSPKRYPEFHSSPRHVPPSFWEEKPFGSLRLIGQLHNSYILCESEEGLVIIDQHAAHERVVFECLKSAYGQSKPATQALLIPERLELSHREADILDTLLKDLTNIGVQIEPFGGKTYMVRAIPEILAGKPVAPLVMEIIEKMGEIGLASGLYRAVDVSLIIMACHGAIRAKEKLSDEQMRALLKQLDNVEHASHCPHGRPIFIRQSLHEIERNLKRIV